MKTKIFAIFLALTVFSGCSQGSGTGGGAAGGEYSSEIFAMDTVMELKIYNADDEPLKTAEAEINRLDALFSKTNENSDIYKINSGEYDGISAETRSLISDALEISKSTDGAFDISIAPVTEIWGFTDEQYRVPAPEEIAAALERVGYEKIKTDGGIEMPDNALIDLGGIAKGYTSDWVTDIFRQKGVTSAIISLGGNVQTLGSKPDGSPWKIGIQNPEKDENAPFLGVLEANEKAVITSGAYQRYFEQDGRIYHHIIDPSTGYPAESGIVSVTVAADSGKLADGLSTALFVMGLEKAEQYWRKNGGFDFIIQTSDKKIYISEGIENSFTSDFEFEVIKQ